MPLLSLKNTTQCAKDCGPHNHAANTGRHIVFTWLRLYFNIDAIIFYVCEGLSQPIANQLNMQTNYGNNIFWLWKPQSLTHKVHG